MDMDTLSAQDVETRVTIQGGCDGEGVRVWAAHSDAGREGREGAGHVQEWEDCELPRLS